MNDYRKQRHEMVEQQIAKRGIRDPRVLAAMRTVQRERFVPAGVREFAYRDSPLLIECDQTISQPFVVALMAEALELGPEDRVLEIGTGSGYAAAVLAELAGEVYSIERHEELAKLAKQRLCEAGYRHVQVRCGDGTRGWPEKAPFDAIVVAAGGPQVPASLREELAPGGRLVIPVGGTPHVQRLLRVTRGFHEGQFTEEELGDVRFVPLVGVEGWPTSVEQGEPAWRVRSASRTAPAAVPRRSLSEQIADAAEPLAGIESLRDADLGAWLERVGDARVVLLGEATHGSSEFYRMRSRLTRALIERKGFDIVAVEADWPDAMRMDSYVRHRERGPGTWQTFSRFPAWMWRNEEVQAFLHWLRDHNVDRTAARRVGFYGLDLYSMYASIAEVLRYLDDVDPESARVARERYGCLTPWQSDPAIYGHAALTGRYRACEEEVAAMLRDLLDQRLSYIPRDSERFLDAVQNARLVVNAERYYRVMYYGGPESWNLRDRHMFETLQMLLSFRGEQSKAVVWAHNSHVGDASATEMSARGEINIGQLCRERYGDRIYLVGFGTHTGTVAAARRWCESMEVMRVVPSDERSYERACHDSGVPAFALPIRHVSEVREALMEPRLERAIGVLYRPQTERASHYFSAVLPRQFDEYIWFDETTAVTPLPEVRRIEDGVPDTYPSGV